jgi:hypothetical protein
MHPSRIAVVSKKKTNEPLLVVGDLGPLLTGSQNSGTPAELLIESVLTPELKSFVDKVLVPALVREYLNQLPTKVRDEE